MSPPVEQSQIAEFFTTLKSETDRAAAVLAAAFVDEFLLRYLKTRLQVPDFDSLYGSNGAVGSFSRRIAIAQALGWLHEDTAHDLNVLRKIRNKFAHEFDHTLSFATQSIRAQTGNLRVLAAMKAELKAVAAKLPQSEEGKAALDKTLALVAQPRQLFEMAVMMITAAIAEGMLQPFAASASAPSAAIIAGKQVAAMFSEFGA